MSRAINLLSIIWGSRSLLATVFFVAVVGVLDENSVMNLIAQWNKNAELKAEIAQYEENYNTSISRLEQLSSSQEAVEEVARVNLLMKSNDEDVYIVEEVKED